MYLPISTRISIVALGLASLLPAQFVNAVRNNQAKTNYVNNYSTWPSDQVVQYKILNPVVNPSAAGQTSTTLQQQFRAPQAFPGTLNVTGLPVRARQALETAGSEETGVVTTTDATGAPRFSTTVNARSLYREPKRSEPYITPLNKALWRSLVYAAEIEPSHSRGRK